jgi:uncharacterized protein (PEP-CTERM system associated)
VQRRQELSLAWLAPRDAIYVAAYRTRRDQVGLGTGSVDLTGGSTSVLDLAIALVATHQLTPLSSIAASVSQIRTKALDSSSLSSQQWDSRLTFNTRLRPDTLFSLEGRHSQFNGEGTASDYRENALSASVLVNF